ncbi:MAG: deoxyribose-phosphate aldolase [candidate division WOR-3 bacterium]
MKNLNKYIDHTLLRPEASVKDIRKLCAEAKRYKFATVFVNPSYVKLARMLLKGTDIKVGCAVGFPLGATTTAVKVFEAQEAVKNGAQEIDMVINIGRVKSKDFKYVESEIRKVVKAVAPIGVKVILETCLLTNQEKIKVAKLALKAGAQFVKTSTGFSTGGATIEDVKLLSKAVGGKIGVKASGGIRDYETALKMIEAGATRIGTSAGVQIITDAKKDLYNERY